MSFQFIFSPSCYPRFICPYLEARPTSRVCIWLVAPSGPPTPWTRTCACRGWSLLYYFSLLFMFLSSPEACGSILTFHCVFEIPPPPFLGRDLNLFPPPPLFSPNSRNREWEEKKSMGRKGGRRQISPVPSSFYNPPHRLFPRGPPQPPPPLINPPLRLFPYGNKWEGRAGGLPSVQLLRE
uniref:Uncharacterized protein n=1 Tax=Morchella brunnea TaxID=1174671 RepID=A0A8K1I847_9PEZI|nr:hypothetical protein LK370_mgp155 [Morchella brunnea]UBU98439.1 hypothetical protein [Morchella brunnea]